MLCFVEWNEMEGNKNRNKDLQKVCLVYTIE